MSLKNLFSLAELGRVLLRVASLEITILPLLISLNLVDFYWKYFTQEDIFTPILYSSMNFKYFAQHCSIVGVRITFYVSESERSVVNIHVICED